ncbi:MAG: pyridoxamine 5'-phosphate oxidase family protein, partial [Acidobacteriota bacterium]
PCRAGWKSRGEETMSQDLGANLPQDLFQFLSSAGPEENSHQVILFTTIDADGWPRHGMLSPYEVVARDPGHILMLLYRDSRTTRNLEREGKVSLVLINPDMSYYVSCSARPLPSIAEAPQECLFALKVERVLEDVLPTASILTGITFEGYDPGMTSENRRQAFGKLQSMPWQQ